ncbi:hypothetical protein SAMN04488020_101538 [Palleronia marisminoris]|uniref:Glycosyl transferase family 8 n=1 Tax=Palleronia marisminoris TaxID=315423 RepID=A0A1Y5RHH7_9RHOB|nr:hypothetical protein [Palleronia marisminoris]SFG21665.1 hypothetical protein SAMN04488020_101538 [Palleronia marisminoris]SLN17506.1 hypothetical protein PAM7066_00539 [Palleronia marisminoris]
MTEPFDIAIVGQAGRIGYESALFAATLRRADPAFDGRLIVLEPQPGPNWPDDPRLSDPVRDLLGTLGAEIRPFETPVFGAKYPYGNKIEGLLTLDPDRPFVFFDSDTLVHGALSALPFDFDRPAASMRREGTWPEPELYGPGYAETWRALYDRFGLDFDSSFDLTQPDEYWERYLYFNAGWFFGRSGPAFGRRFLDYATAIRDDPPEEVALQSFDPWLDQVALPLVIHSFGGGRPCPELSGLDGEVTTHYRTLPLLYARERDEAVAAAEGAMSDNRIKKVLKEHEPFKRFILQNKGAKARALFDRTDLPRKEQAIRNRLKANNLWMR